MDTYKKYNLITGWLAFAIAAITYLMTIEPTASLWDCSEFIATSYKLEVGHPPGAPLFMMISRFFTLFAADTAHVAMMVNAMSALASAFTILFLCWTITHLARKCFKKSREELSQGQIIAIMGAGLVGALAYTFSDTFWFSAVEGEVYGLSSFFTAIVFWAMLQWENVADQPHANRWLVLIAYLMGLSIGVHLLNLLAFPAMIFIYYFKKYPQTTRKGVIYATLAAGAVVIYVLYVLIPWTVQIGAFVDRMFVNGLGFPVNAGMAIYALLLFAVLGFAVWYTHKKGKVLWNTFLLMTTVVLLGYSSYASVIIRSAANPPMNSNGPSNPYGLYSLLARDQYGQRPLVHGQNYASLIVDYDMKTTYYVGDDGKYQPIQRIAGYKFEPTSFFPRMHSNREGHVEEYKVWGQVDGRPVKVYDQTVVVPTFGENLRFFFAYQVNFMYWRYFLWNFVGRQSDLQSTGSITDGNWLSGITPIDEIYLGPQKDLPSDTAANKGRNKYYFLPFLLGLVGLLYHLNRDGKDFSVVMWLFFMTGLAIVLYLNQTPSEPRERDYAYAGSFYAFAIWIGLGVLWIWELLSKALRKPAVAGVVATVLCVGVPVLMAAQNWDDHDRSHRYVARDFGHNYLEACLPNAIIMDYGDNDTFPLWYNQEVENVRTDVRVMNTSYLGGEWYIDQMRVKSYESEPVPFSLPRAKYYGRDDLVPVEEVFKEPVPIAQIMGWIMSDDKRTKASFAGMDSDFIPARTILLPVNKANVLASGIVTPRDEALIEDTVVIQLKNRSLDRSELMVLDMLANFDWKRPLYLTSPSLVTAFGLENYLQFDGFAYRIVPIRTPFTYSDPGRIDTEYLYERLMKTFKYGNVKDPRVYIDNTITNSFEATHARDAYGRLAKALVAEGDTIRAREVLEYGLREIPFDQIPYSYLSTIPIIEAYYAVGDLETANDILNAYAGLLKEHVTYMMGFPTAKRDLVSPEIRRKASELFELYNVAGENGQMEIVRELDEYFKALGLVG